MLPPPEAVWHLSRTEVQPTLSFRARDFNPEHSHKRYTPWSVFQDGRMSSIYTLAQQPQRRMYKIFGDHASNHTPTSLILPSTAATGPKCVAWIVQSSTRPPASPRADLQEGTTISQRRGKRGALLIQTHFQ
jgi:hypothetical protein